MEKELNHAFMSIRIPTQRWSDEAQFRAVLNLLDAHPGVVDELALFTAFTHPPLPLAVIRQQVPVLKERIRTAKSGGYACGINILATMGHHNENLANSMQEDYTRRTDLDGKTCLGSFCPNDDRFIRDYVVPLYTLISQAEPDFIWIDDDVRTGHMGIGHDCFCDHCLRHFADYCGRLLTRPDMKVWLNEGSRADQMERRKLWLQAKRDTFTRLFSVIEQTTHAINPAIVLGFMTGERYADGYGFADQAKALAGPGRQEVRWRPGGGFYRDTTLTQLTEKAHQLGRQIALLPPSVVSIQSEIENFNYEALGKSVAANTAEVAAYIGAGCTGAALNIMNVYEDIVLEKSRLLSALAAHRPFFDRLVTNQGRRPPQGIFTGWSTDSLAAVNIDKDWFEGPEGLNSHFADQWFEIGLPMAYAADSAPVVLWKGNAPYAFSAEQIKTWLSRGVYLDGPALEALNAMGYGDLTGFAVSHYEAVDCIDELLEHELNGPQQGSMRDCRQSFWKCPCASLVPTAAGASPLARAVDYGGQTMAACCMGVFENRLGGRVCVSGYYPWEFVLSHAKAEQGRRIMRWLSRDALPAFVSSLHKVNLWTRATEIGAHVLTLFSQSLDTAEGLAVKIRTDRDRLRVTGMDLSETIVRASGQDGPYRQFVLPDLGPWQLMLAVTE